MEDPSSDLKARRKDSVAVSPTCSVDTENRAARGRDADVPRARRGATDRADVVQARDAGVVRARRVREVRENFIFIYYIFVIYIDGGGA